MVVNGECEEDFHVESQDADIINVKLYYFFLNFLDRHRTNTDSLQPTCTSSM